MQKVNRATSVESKNPAYTRTLAHGRQMLFPPASEITTVAARPDAESDIVIVFLWLAIDVIRQLRLAVTHSRLMSAPASSAWHPVVW